MDRNGSSRDLLPSRLRILEESRELWLGGKRVFLLTGESGAGKTLLAQKISQTVDREVRWIWVELTSRTSATGFYLQLSHQLGLEPANEPVRLRLAVLDWLNAKITEGSRWSFVIEGVHMMRPTVAEELLILADRLERGEGPSGMVLTGQTPALGKLRAEAFSPLERRLDAQLRLTRINADEAQFLLERVYPTADWAPSVVDRLHCDAHGNPRELIRAAWKLGRPRAPERILHEPGLPTALPEHGPLLGPSRKPLVEGDGVIEVGWDGVEDDLAESPQSSRLPVQTREISELDERVDDHYAALQAWDEWTKHGFRKPVRPDETSLDAESQESRSWNEALELEPTTDPGAAPVRVRLDAEEPNAPYSKLFGKAHDSTRPSS